jgi:hypothetical protein
MFWTSDFGCWHFLYFVVFQIIELLINYFLIFSQGNRQSLADRFDYVMYGKLYRIADGSGRGTKAYVVLLFRNKLSLLYIFVVDCQRQKVGDN